MNLDKNEENKQESFSDYKPLLVPTIMGLLPWGGTALMIYLIKTYPSLIETADISTQILILSGMAIALAMGLMHASMASIAMGYYLGWKGLLIFGIPYVAACVLAFYICKFLDKGKLNSFLNVMYSKWELHAKDATKNPFAYVFFLRLTPVFPFAITNYLLSTLNINFWKMLIASAAGQLPRSALFVWVGTLITDWVVWTEEGSGGEFMIWKKMPGNTAYYWWGLLILGIIVLYTMWKRADKLSKAEE